MDYTKFNVLNDTNIKKQNNDSFLSNLSKERERQNNAIGVSSSSLGNGSAFKADNQYKSPLSDVKIKEPKNSQPWIYHNIKPKDYVTNRYSYEKQNPSDETKALQTSLNNFGYVGKDNKPLKVDGAYGPNTDHAFNNAWKNNEQVIKNNEFVKARDKVTEAVNNAYAPLMEKAETRKWNMPKEEIEVAQNFLNDFGYTDWQGNKLKVNGVLDSKTRGALEKHIQDGTPKQTVLDMQKLFNDMGLTDKDDNPLTPDGKLGVKTDGAVQKAVKQYGNVAEQEPVRGDVENAVVAEYNAKSDYYSLLDDAHYILDEKPASPSDNIINMPVVSAEQPINVSKTPIQKPDIVQLSNKVDNKTTQRVKSDNYSNTNATEDYVAKILESNPLNTKKNNATKSFMPDVLVKIVEDANRYPNDTVHLNDYFWKSGYKTADISGVQKVLNSRKGVNLEANGDIKDATAIAITNYAKANNLTLEQASDRLVELGRMYNEVEKMGFKGNEIEQIQIKLNQLGIKGEDGNALGQDNLLGNNTLSAIKELSNRYTISTKDTINILLNKSDDYPDDVNVLSESFANVCTDAENAYILGIITEAEKNIVIKDAIQEQLDTKSQYIKCKDDIIENNKFIDSLEKILEFGVFNILLGDVDSGTAYSPSEADYVRQKMYGNEDNYIKIFVASLAHQSGYKGTNVGNVVKINGEFWRVDIEYPQGNKPGNLHVQLKDKNIPGTTSPRKMIKTLDDLDELPKAVRKNPAIRKAVERGLKTLGKIIL